MNALDLTPFVLTDETLFNLRHSYRWNGWVLDLWQTGHSILWHEDHPAIMEFGTPAELVARALEMESAA